MVRAVTKAYREAFSGLSRPVWFLAIVTFINRSGTMVLPFLVLYLTEKRGFTATAAGRALGIYGVGAVAGAYLGGWLCDRLTPRKVMALSLLGQGAGFLVLGLLESRGGILAMMLALSLVGEALHEVGRRRRVLGRVAEGVVEARPPTPGPARCARCSVASPMTPGGPKRAWARHGRKSRTRR